MVDENELASVYISTDITQSYGSYYVWEKWIYKKAQKTGNGKHAKYYKETVYLVEYTNDFSKNKLLSYTKYNSKGKVVDSASWEYGDWDYIVPGSVGEAIAEGIQYIINYY